MAKKSRTDWTPNTPAAELINYWAHGRGSEPLHKPAAERCYAYVQEPRSVAESMFRRPQRRRRYVVRVTEDHAGRRHARTERYDPERGSASRTGHGSPTRVEIPELPTIISFSIMVFAVAVFVIIMVTIPFPLNSIIGLYWAFSLHSRVFSAVQRARFARQLARRKDNLPPLLSPEELDARLLALASPDEDRSFDEPAPIPLPGLLRDRAWKRWEERYSIRAVREVGERYMEHPEAFEGPRLSVELRGQALRAQSARDKLDHLAGRVGARSLQTEIALADAELAKVALLLGCEIRGIEHPSMLTSAPPQLDRPFATKTDCADGHVGEHPIIATFVDPQGRQRVTRACKWCPSEWSDLV